jgi:glycosyltransferase involved in cell wall biosynthesis
MKIWIVKVGEPLPELDGATRLMRCAMLTKAAVEAGHKVTRWSATFDHNNKKHRGDPQKVYAFGKDLEIRLMDGPGYRANRSPSRFFHQRAEANSFRDKAKNCEIPDVIFCCLPTPTLCEAAVDFGQGHKVPVIIDVRDLWPDQYLTVVPPILQKWLKPLLVLEYRSLRKFLSRSAGITAVSKTYLKWAVTHASRDIGSRDGVFPIGYPDLPIGCKHEPGLEVIKEKLRRQLMLEEGSFTIIFVGAFVSSIDFDTVFIAARRLENLGYRMRFLFAGAGDVEARARRLAEGIRSVTFLGWVKSNQELRALLQLANVGLAPYRIDCTQSLPNKPFEYMASGLPQVCSIPGEMAQIIENERIGLNYAGNDADDLCRCLIQLSENRAAAQELGENGRRLFLKEYSSELIYPRLLKHLVQVTNRVETGKETLRISKQAHFASRRKGRSCGEIIDHRVTKSV